MEKYSIVWTFKQTIHFQYRCNFFHMQIISQSISSNQLKQINTLFITNHFINSNYFCNHSHTLELEREKWRTNSKMETKERAEEQTKNLVALDSNPRSLDQFGCSSSSSPIPIQLTIILLVGYSKSSIQVYFLPDSPFPYLLSFFRKSLTFFVGIFMPHF